MPRVWDVPVHDSTRVRDARVAAEHAAALAGLDEQRTAAAALVATELATNLLKHAGGGQVLIDVVAPPVLMTGREHARLVQVATVDHGPGIADVSAALSDGFTTTQSLGAGLGTCARLADDFDLHSVPGRGTVVVARIGAVLDRPAVESGPASRVRAGAVNVPFGGAEYSGDAWAWVRDGDRVTLMLADGLGHGPEAARASTAAVETLRGAAHLPPAEALRRLDKALAGTRGAAVAVAQVDTRAAVLRFAGIGNIGARLCEGGTWRHLVSRPGIVGTHRPTTLREEETAWADDRVLVLHSDGLPSRWAPTSDTCRTATDPAVTAAVTVRDASSSARPVRDDTAVAVLTPTPPDRP
ncbi:putative magnesium or manganese-dependent protein phosphatase [Streptomyces ambofaciens ATCC 23877]|uniref:Putative magnesium or manganese-dependent protein phosphatase n=1 Tax=Streptomyces ambofaciens (strain ATCC 23877 / 3486 / DSM 40053 / JCM 4204 / NBRC 12836 / NRRL B-2516) TaxID=278992 RepID=A3KJA6_STRA7|nr:ATP-binding SpoIIE family protein phosphatase [Streptomyces ambofaciens]AKZ53938.1 putative magnesium or manganese-dependent protein phosphatase [Streptomyces ambofaciens ATCC 23877]CAJ89790.1 putative magnesium or manganese-dependent protein phosphatase [Streptomyces ambofaciens ATCC 23877]